MGAGRTGEVMAKESNDRAAQDRRVAELRGHVLGRYWAQADCAAESLRYHHGWVDADFEREFGEDEWFRIASRIETAVRAPAWVTGAPT